VIHQNEVKRYGNVVSLIKKWCLNRNGRRKCNNKVIDGNVDINANEIANSMNGKIYCINSENNINGVLLTLFHGYIGARENSNSQNEKITTAIIIRIVHLTTCLRLRLEKEKLIKNRSKPNVWKFYFYLFARIQI